MFANRSCSYIFCRVFRDVPSDIIIEVEGGAFSLHKVRLCTSVALSSDLT